MLTTRALPVQLHQFEAEPPDLPPLVRPLSRSK